MTSHAPVPGGLYDPGGPLPGDSVEAQWVNLRRRRIPVWIATTVGSVASAVAITVRMATELGKPSIGASEITGGVVFLVGAVAVAVWTVRMAPRVFTRQGVAADGIGVALIQDPNLWFTGRTVRIPWEAVGSVGEREAVTGRRDDRRKVRMVTLEVDTGGRDITVPSWASVRGSPPWVRVDIMPGALRRSKVTRALHSVRPDLFA